MNHATLASTAQVLNVVIVTVLVFGLSLVVNGIVKSAIACWKATGKKSNPQPIEPIAYHYACPLTCELPPAPQKEISNPVEVITKTMIGKLKKEQVIDLLEQHGLKSSDYSTLRLMKHALKMAIG